MERGADGTKHLQACMGGKQYRFTALKKIWPKMHIECARDSYVSWQYCGKEETRVSGPAEYGVPPAQRNKAGNVAGRNSLLLTKGAA